MRAFLRLAIQCYLVLAVLAGVPAGASRVVLCVAPNGHVAIEVGEKRCEDPATPPQGTAEAAAPRMAPDGCDDCVDVPVGAPVLGEARARNTVAASELSPAGLSQAAGFAQTMPASSVRVRPGSAATWCAAFPPSRTTILRN